MSTTAGPSSITLLTTWTLCDVLARGVLKPSEVEYVTEEIVRRTHPPLDAVRELVAKWRADATGAAGYSYTTYEEGRIAEKRRCADELEYVAFAAAPEPPAPGNGCMCEPAGSDGLRCPRPDGTLLCMDPKPAPGVVPNARGPYDAYDPPYADALNKVLADERKALNSAPSAGVSVSEVTPAEIMAACNTIYPQFDHYSGDTRADIRRDVENALTAFLDGRAAAQVRANDSGVGK
jgi:hypothetical protein